jgi:hypothetical protein
MAIPFISSLPRKEASEIRGYFMRHKTGVDVGFSWKEDDPRYAAEHWERIPAVAEFGGYLKEGLDFELRVMQEFLQWNRAQATPVAVVTREYAAARKVLSLAGLTGLYGPEGLFAKIGLLDEARRAISSLLDALKGVKYVDSSRAFGQQVLAKLEAVPANAKDEVSPAVPADSSEGADARLVCKVAREAGTPISVETARAILAALKPQAIVDTDAASSPKED